MTKGTEVQIITSLLICSNANIQRCLKNYWGIMHNFRKVNPSPQLDEIIA
jgi:hypothetical protein